MNSPNTGRKMPITISPQSLVYRKDNFEIQYHNYRCEKTRELFTDDKLDDLNTTQVHNQYREKYGIPYVDQIVQIRKKYDISSAKMSEILGFGTNSYRLYESGEMPSVSNGRIIQSIEEPEEFIKQIKLSSHLLKPKDLNKLLEKAENAKESDLDKKSAFAYNFNNVPMEYIGYKKLHIEKVLTVINYLSQSIILYKTKLNKLLFYTDFAYFKETGFSMTGLSYRAIDLGPVPSHYASLYSSLAEKKWIAIEEELFENGNYGEKIVAHDHTIQTNELSVEEKNILDKIIHVFKDMNAKKIVDKSHREPAWIENVKNKDLISYKKYAFSLKEM